MDERTRNLLDAAKALRDAESGFEPWDQLCEAIDAFDGDGGGDGDGDALQELRRVWSEVTAVHPTAQPDVRFSVPRESLMPVGVMPHEWHEADEVTDALVAVLDDDGGGDGGG